MKLTINEPKYSFNLSKENITPRVAESIKPYSGDLDYELLKNKPQLNGQEIIGNMSEIDPTVSAWAKESSKPSYTANEVGAVDKENQLGFEELDRMFKAVFGN